MRFEIFSLLPEVFPAYLSSSILAKAIENEIISVNVHNIRDWATDKHHITDEPPFGGGGGMVIKPEPVFAAVESVLGDAPDCPVILLTPQGRVFNQRIAQELAQLPRIAMICGRYEGFDERIRQYLATDELSIGDFVLTGGELPAMVILDAVSRNLSGVLGDPTGAYDDSHAQTLLEYPHYTRPAVFRGWTIPDVLLSGNHARIAQWRRRESIRRTRDRRPDLLERAELSSADYRILDALITEEISPHALGTNAAGEPVQ